MCGIAGLFEHGAAYDGRPAVQAMLNTLVHRGPDAEGIWVDSRGRSVLGSRRLSIIDTSHAGDQPMSSADGRWVIAFNGEIYNFEELRQSLSAKGIAFRGHSDTEVLVNCIALYGIAALGMLDGMFAIAAFDVESGELLLARDPFGEKPLYYVELPGGGLAFASELQALEQLPQFDAEVSTEAMAEMLLFQYIGAPRCIYRSVRKLPPGHWLRTKVGKPPAVTRYFAFKPAPADGQGRSLADYVDELEEILVRGLRRRLISDVPMGAFLSGGIDSSLTCALAKNKLGVALRTFSLGFVDARESEHEAAQTIAEHLGLEHSRMMLPRDAVESLEVIGSWLDEPNADWSCLPQFMLAGFTRKHVTVALSGDGGDEMFGGYDRYGYALNKEQSAKSAGTPLHAGASYYGEGIMLLATDAKIAQLLGGLPAGVADHLNRLRDDLDDTSEPLLCRMRRSDVENYLPGAVLAKVDRMSMRHSLEVRTPFLSVELARFAESVPLEFLWQPGRGKLLLRELARRHLPAAVTALPKTGFGLPGVSWAQAEIQQIGRRLLAGPDCRLGSFFGPEVLENWLLGPVSVTSLWSLITLESWLRHHPARLPEVSRRRNA